MLVFPVGTPLVSWALLLKCRGTLRMRGTNALVDATAFIHHDYEPGFYAWECLEILRRFFFVGVITVALPAGSVGQMFAALIVAITWLLLVTLAKPFKADSDNAIAVSCSFALVVILNITLVFQLADLAEGHEDVMSEWQYDLLKTNEEALSFAMGAFLVFAFLLVVTLIGGQAYLKYLKEKETAEWSVPTLDPPHFQWRPKRGLYTCFLRRVSMHMRPAPCPCPRPCSCSYSCSCVTAPQPLQDGGRFGCTISLRSVPQDAPLPRLPRQLDPLRPAHALLARHRQERRDRHPRLARLPHSPLVRRVMIVV